MRNMQLRQLCQTTTHILDLQNKTKTNYDMQTKKKNKNVWLSAKSREADEDGTKRTLPIFFYQSELLVFFPFFLFFCFFLSFFFVAISHSYLF